MALYESIDLKFNDFGDFEIDERGDFVDTGNDLMLSIKQEIRDRVKSEEGDWIDAPGIGANLDRFIGSPNIRETARNMDEAIRLALIIDNLIIDGTIEIRTIPVGINQTSTRISIATSGGTEIVQFAYDWGEKGVTDIISNQIEEG